MELSWNLLSFLASVSVRSLCLAAAALAVIPVFRIQSPGARHAVWTMVMAGMLLLAALTPVLPPMQLPILRAVPAPVGQVIDLSADSFRQQIQPSGRIATAPPQSSPGSALPVYGFVSLIFLARLAYGYLFAVRLVRASRHVENDLYESAWISVPMTAGFVRPKVLLPAGWDQWDALKLQSVLAHERAHIRRGDWAIAMLAGLNRSIFWFHPLAWWLSRHLASLAEQACDDAALLQVGTREHYAQALLDMAAAVKSGTGRLLPEAMAMAKASEVRLRIDRILDESRPIPRGVTRGRWAALLACGLALVYLTAVVEIVPAAAQQQPAAAAVGEPVNSQALEQHLAGSPHDVEARRRLILYYYSNGIREPRLSHVYWLIENHPESSAALLASQGILSRTTSLNDSSDFARAVALWKQQAANHFNDPRVLMNAAQFLAQQGGDIEEAELYLKTARGLEPSNQVWTERLGRFYAAIVVGETGVKQFPNFPAMAARIRSQLESSKDGWLLYYAGSALVTMAQDLDSKDHPEIVSILDLGHRLKARAGENGIQGSVDPTSTVRVAMAKQSPAPAPPDQPAIVLTRVRADYPPLARQARISGEVNLKVRVTDAGRVAVLEVGTGHPLLVPSAIAAVKQWTFRPATTRGVPVESVLEVPVLFVLEESPSNPVRPQASARLQEGIRAGSDLMAGKLVKQPQAVYPEQARREHIAGSVTLEIMVAEDGSVQSVRAIEGHPLLAAAAENAVREWKYQPTLLDGLPVKVVTTVEIPFRLN